MPATASPPVAAPWRERVERALDALGGDAPGLALDGPVFVYGAGRTGREVVALLRARGVAVEGVLDARSAAADVDGAPVRRPDDPRVPAPVRAGAHVLIAVFNRETAVAPIVGELRRLGYGRVTTFLALHAAFADALGDRYWLTDRRWYVGRRDALLDGLELWADDASRELYTRLVEFRLSGSDAVLPEPEAAQYLPPDLPPLPEPVALVDCGAYDGDTVEELRAAGVALGEVCAFEPDPGNFSALAARARALASGGTALRLWPAAVGRTTGVLRFAAGDGEASHVAEHGGTVIPCVALDDVLVGGAPTFLKMDIEGHEPEALEGAARLVARHRPRLAVCVYHAPDHLWRIPRLVRELWPGYRLYLRQHARHGFEVVLYAIP